MRATEIDEAGAGTHVLVGDPGDDAVAMLSDFARDQQITAAQFSAIGAFQRATVGWFDRERQIYHRIEVDEQCEVLSLLGDIAVGDDGPQVHSHVVLGLSDGSTRGGHLLAGTVWPTLEVVVRETQAELRRTSRPDVGLALIDPARTAQTEPNAAPVAAPAPSRVLAVLCGIALILLGAWGALSPFIGPSFNFGFSPDGTWVWTSARGWLEVLPGSVAAIGGLVMLVNPNRLVLVFGGILGAAAGAWFIVGTSFADLLHIGSMGAPLGTRPGIQSLEWLALFYGLGGVILLLVAFVLGRVSVRSGVRVRTRRRTVAVAPVAAANSAPSAERARLRPDMSPAPSS
jgi:hypothetical protein